MIGTLYHYCNTSAFVSIIDSRSILLSSLSLSNDSMEGKIVNKVILELAKEDGLCDSPLEYLQHSACVMEKIIDGLGFCLSEDGDLLSQWRGYADNGSGISIGFSKAYLDKLTDPSFVKKVPNLELNKVEYEPQTHRKLIAPTYIELKKLIDTGAFNLGTHLTIGNVDELKANLELLKQANLNLFLRLMTLFSKLFLLKSYGFREEREWRLVSIEFRGLADFCDYRAAFGRIIPYIKFEIPDFGIQAIHEVVLGPRHTTPPEVVDAMLKRYGFNDVRVRSSETTYR